MSTETETDLVEQLARASHQLWLRAKVAEGFHGGARTNPLVKVHRDIDDWDKLDEHVRESYLTPTAQIIAAISECGYELIYKDTLDRLKADAACALNLPQNVDKPALGAESVDPLSGHSLRRVKVMSGRGIYAYWYANAPLGALAEWRVVVDLVDNPMASHRAGKLLEAAEGRVGEETWLIVGS